MEQTQLDELYERASEHYLNGRFAEALQAWRQLLSLSPGDERAKEGIRLAEIMADGEAAPEVAGPEPTGPVHAAPPAVPPTPPPAIDPAADPAVAHDGFDAAPGRVIEIEEDLLGGEPAEAAPEPVSPVDVAPEPAGPPEPAAPVGEAGSSDLDDSLSVFDSLSVPGLISSPAVRDEAHATSPEKTPAADSEPAKPEPVPASESIDFGDLSSVESIPTAPKPQTDPVAAPAAPESAPEADASPPAFEDPSPSTPTVDEPADFAPPSDLPTPSDTDAVATELQKRIDDLLAEARAVAGEGRDDDALGILSRIAILDEENLEARALEEEIRQRTQDTSTEIETWMIEGVQWLELGQTKEAHERFKKVLEVAPEHLEAQDYLAKAEARLSGEEPAPVAGDNPDPDFVADFAPESLSEETLNHEPMAAEPDTDAVPLAMPQEDDAAPVPTPGVPKPLPAAAPKARSSRRLSPVLMVILVVVVAAVGAGAWYGPKLMDRFLGNAADEAAGVVESAVASLPQPGTEAVAEPAEQPAAPAATTPTDLSPAERAERIAASIGQGRKAMEAADYSAAIVAFDEVLAIDPANVEARRWIEEAGEGYRAQKEADQQLFRGRTALEDGDYVSALRILYRLPDTVDQMRVAEYKVVGWYNLGLIELKAADCKTAVEHFSEALAIAPNDAHLRRVRDLAGSYIDRQKDSRFYREIETLDFLTPSR
jgi:tetratricopeptide (TPR) repeat protein